MNQLDVFDFHNFLSRSYLILTDSGGIQEEAPSYLDDTADTKENEDSAVDAGTSLVEAEMKGRKEQITEKEMDRRKKTQYLQIAKMRIRHPYRP